MDRPPICATVIEAGKEIGLEYREDVNDLPPGAGDCIGWCQQTRGGRRRASTARTYLRPALKRPNLQLVTKALVHRILFDGKRAVGVEFSRGGPGGAVERADAAREVILSAGAVGSPHILQLSGVGDPEHLGRIGVPVVHELRGVGKNMQDHYVARVSYPVVGAQTANERSRGLPLAGEVMRWLFTGKGMLTYSPSLVAASVKVLEESATPDVQVHVRAGQLQGRPDRRARGDARPQRRRLADAAAVARLCRGQVEPARRHAGDQPALSLGGNRPARHRRRPALCPADFRRAGAEAVRPARRACRAPQVQTDDELLDYARRNGGTCYHASCTCMMGSHAMAVVDDELRVHGLDGLRVIDASVMPAVTSTNTNAPTIMIAEKGAAMIKAPRGKDWRLSEEIARWVDRSGYSRAR